MTALAAIISASLAALPAAYEVDFRPLPPANTSPAYRFAVTISLDGKPDVPLDLTLGRGAPAEFATRLFVASLDDPLWKLERNGDRVVVYSYDKARVTKITVTGDGPKPDIRRVLILPKK